MLHTPSKLIVLFSSAFLVFAVLWRWAMAPYLLMIPEDFTYSADLESVDNFYNAEKDAYNGPQYSETTFSYQVMSSTEKGLEIENLFHVHTIEGTEIFSTQRIYGIDPKTGAHVQGLGDKDREGFLFAPRNLKKGEPYSYWHVNYDGPAEMSFVGEETLYDLTVYHYETYYDGIVVDQTADLDYLPGVPEEKGIKVTPHLEVWIEPISGYLVKYQDETTAYYYDIETGETLSPWNHFSNTYTDESVAEQAALAYSLKNKTVFFQSYLPLIFVLLGFFILSSGIWSAHANVKRELVLKPFVAAFMILVPILSIISIWYLIAYNLEHYSDLEFEERVEDVEETIKDRMEIYINTLQGTSALFAISDGMDRNRWSVYVKELDLENRYPGVEAVGFAKVVSAEEKEAFIQAVRAEGLTDYTIYPEGEREVYAPALYREGRGGNIAPGLGFDLYSEPIREAGVIQARDSGSASLSGRVELQVTEGDKIGFVLYIPIYKNGAAHETIEERRASIYGYVYAPFRMSALMQGIFEDSDLGLSFDIYDGTTVNAEHMLYSSTGVTIDAPDSSYLKTETIYLAGHPWTFRFISGEQFELSTSQKLIRYGALGGSLVLVALYLFSYYSLMIVLKKSLDYIRKKNGS